MSRQVEWLQHVPAALDALQHLGTPVIDRPTLQRLLSVHRRTAIRLMHGFGGYQAGKTFLIDRARLIQRLAEVAAGDPYHYAAQRRERLVDHLDRTRRELAARRVKIPIAPDVAFRELSGLPRTIRLAPGKLEITCTDAQDLLRQLMELAQGIANDYEKFERVVKP